MLCLGTFISVIIECKINSNKATQKNIVGQIMHSVEPDYDETDDAMAANLAGGKKNPSDYAIEGLDNLNKSNFSDVAKYFKNNLLELIKQNKYDTIKRQLD